MNYDECSEFSKELKQFTKKWPSLPKDLEKAKDAIETLYVPNDEFDIDELRQLFFGGKRAAILHTSEDCEIVKMRLDCASLGKKELLRLIFVFSRATRAVTFIELYAKNEKSREDEKRIRKYIK
jgi:hypothetical protein